jgi:hypothetical protein
MNAFSVQDNPILGVAIQVLDELYRIVDRLAGTVNLEGIAPRGNAHEQALFNHFEIGVVLAAEIG